MNNFWKNLNYNKWNKHVPDCQIRSLCSAIGIDYEVACKKLGVECVEGKGFIDTNGIDLYYIHEKFRAFLGPIEDMMDNFEDPVDALIHGISLNSWLEEHKKDNQKYLVYLDDNKEKDGGHIVSVTCNGDNTYFVDTFDCGEMYVQAYCKVIKVLPKDSKYHWKYDKETKKFI